MPSQFVLLIILLLLLFALFETSIGSVDPKFEACQPKTCGNNQSITYPFYIIGKQEPFCGNPGFELTCNKNGFPILNLTNTQYIVQEIMYSNQSLRVSNPVFSESNTSECIAPTQNLTVGQYSFKVASNQRDMFLFYGCDLTSLSDQENRFGRSSENKSSSVVVCNTTWNRSGCSSENKTSSVVACNTTENKIGCSSENKTSSVVVFGNITVSVSYQGLKKNIIGCSSENKTSSVVGLYREDPNLGIGLENYCKGGVVNTKVENEKGGIVEALREGFVLNWNASDCSECSSSGGKCGFDQDTYTFRCYCNDRPHAFSCDPESGKTGHKFVVIIATTVSAALGIGVLIIIVYCIRKSSWSHKLNGLWKDKSKAHQDFEAFLRSHGPLAIRRYSYLEIKKMTNSFAEKLGQGGYGGVFKGKILGENLVAVKMLNSSKGNGEEFINEVASISRTSHVNIVTLLGFCFEGSKRALVYEYMANGSLEKFIYGTNPMRNQDSLITNVVSVPVSTNQHLALITNQDHVDLDSPMRVNNQLNCETLCQIAIGVARGLEYLHKGCNTRIFHFDIKPHNILLDENFCPKISDFGLAKICPTNESMVSMFGARGTPGYIAPEVFSRNFGPVSHKSDVYSFGMMVLEMVGGRKNINVEVDCTSEIYFPYWIYKRLELNEEFALKNITNESDREKMRKMVIVSLWCIQTDPSDRPTMRAVVDMLEGRVETLQIPPKPFLSSPSRSSPHSSVK